MGLCLCFFYVCMLWEFTFNMEICNEMSNNNNILTKSN